MLVAEARGWNRRLPTAVFTVGPFLSVALVLALDWNQPGAYPATIGEAAAWNHFAEESLNTLAVATAFTAWFAPRLSGVILAILLQPWATAPVDHPLYGILMWLWPAVLILDAALVLRQRSRAVWEESPAAPPERVRVLDVRPFRLAVAGVLVLASIVGFGLWIDHRSELIDLGDRVVQGTGTVVSQDTVVDSVEMRVGANTYDFMVGDASSYPLGTTHPVFVDPTGERRPFGTEDADPTGWSFLPAAIPIALLVAGLVGIVPTWRRRRIESLAEAGAVWTDVLVRQHPHGPGVEIFAADDSMGKRPLSYLPSLEDAWTIDESFGSRESLWTSVQSVGPRLRTWARSRLAGSEDSDDFWYLEDSDDEWDSDGDDEEFPAAMDWQPIFAALTSAKIAGFRADGSLCLLRTAPGEMWASIRPARDRWTLRALLAGL